MSLFGKKQEVMIEGMKCEHCAAHMKDALESIDGVKSVKVDLKEKKAVVSSKDGISESDAKKAVESCNKTFVSIKDL